MPKIKKTKRERKAGKVASGAGKRKTTFFRKLTPEQQHKRHHKRGRIVKKEKNKLKEVNDFLQTARDYKGSKRREYEKELGLGAVEELASIGKGFANSLFMRDSNRVMNNLESVAEEARGLKMNKVAKKAEREAQAIKETLKKKYSESKQKK